MRKIIILGSIGAGKSTTANTLAEGDYFTVGEDDSDRITKTVHFKEANDNLMVVDCLGFDDAQECGVFYDEVLKHKREFLNAAPIDVFILVVKFDQKEASNFLTAARNFTGSFSNDAIKSLIILCIQGNPKIRYCQEEFKDIVKDSDGYKFLIESNEGKEIPYCLWDNYKPYFNQAKTLEKCFEQLNQFNRLMMRNALEMIENDVEARNS